MTIKDWPADERPREKLLSRGPEALSDAELLAIFLRTGVAGKSAVDLARELLMVFGGGTPPFGGGSAGLQRRQGSGGGKVRTVTGCVGNGPASSG